MLNKKTFPIVLLIVIGMLSGCVRPTPQPTPTTMPSATVEVVPTPTLKPSPTLPPTLAPAATEAPATGAALPFAQTRFFEDGSGWAASRAGTAIYHTQDGILWQTVTPPDMSLEGSSGFGNAFFLDGSHAWVSLSDAQNESSVLFASADGGQTWISTKQDFAGGRPFFLNEQTGYLLSDLGVGAGSQFVAIYHTADGGKTWDLRFKHDPEAANPSLPTGGIKGAGLVFLQENVGFIGGSIPISGYLYTFSTQDGGKTWAEVTCTNLPIKTENDFFEGLAVIKTSQEQAILPVSAFSGDKSYVYFCGSSDGGQTWAYLSEIEGAHRAVSFADATNGLALTEDALWRTTDGGQTWAKLDAQLPAGESVVSVQLLPGDAAYLLTWKSGDGEDDNFSLYRSADAGVTWDQVQAVIEE